jgi:hypothetical protein
VFVKPPLNVYAVVKAAYVNLATKFVKVNSVTYDLNDDD